MTIMEFSVDAKGRVTVPAAARAIAGLTPGHVRGRVEAGRIVLETSELVQERIWARAGISQAADTCSDGSAAAEHEAAGLRAREREVGGAPMDAVGEQLLADLGL